MTEFPSTLPQPTLEGYGLELQRHGVISAIDNGAMRIRQRSRLAAASASATWQLTADELQAFRIWAAACIGWFVISLPGPLGIEPMTVRRMGTWTETPLAPNLWSVKLALEVRRINRIDGEYLELALAYDPYDIHGAFITLHPWVSGQLTEDYYP